MSYYQIVNPKTNKKIYLYGDTYNKLIKNNEYEESYLLNLPKYSSQKMPKSPKILSKYNNNNLNTLPTDILKEIANENNSILPSLLSTNKQLYNQSTYFKNELALNKALKHRPKNILKLKPGDRLIVGDGNNDKNYIVLTRNNNIALCQHVDLLGYIIIGHEKPIEIKLIKNDDEYEWIYGEVSIRPGLVLFDYDPEIDSIDSHYFKYKTTPLNEPEPSLELNLMILLVLKIPTYYYIYMLEYVVINIKDNLATLKYAGEFKNFIYNEHGHKAHSLSKNLIMNINKREIINDDGFEILRIGGFGETTICDPGYF